MLTLKDVWENVRYVHVDKAANWHRDMASVIDVVHNKEPQFTREQVVVAFVLGAGQKDVVDPIEAAERTQRTLRNGPEKNFANSQPQWEKYIKTGNIHEVFGKNEWNHRYQQILALSGDLNAAPVNAMRFKKYGYAADLMQEVREIAQAEGIPAARIAAALYISLQK